MMQSKNLSIMLTDLQGYSTKSAESSRTDLMSLVNTHNQLLRPVIDFYRGVVVKTMGDAFLCTFESATDAAICAIAIQVLTREYNRQLKNESALVIRVAISSGDVSLEEGDIYGEAVNLVSRMEKLPELAEGGIALSEATYLLVNRQEIVADPIGEHEFKGISQPVKVFKLDLKKQKLDKLPTRLLAFVRQVAGGKGGFSLSGAKGGQWWRGRKRLVAACLAFAILVVFFGVPLVALRGPNAEEMQVFDSVLNSSNGGPVIREKDWVGTPESFREIDTLGVGVIGPLKIAAWAKRKGFRPPGFIGIWSFWFFRDLGPGESQIKKP